MKKIITILIVLVAAFLFTTCKDDDDPLTPIDLLIEDYDNIPVKVNTLDSYTFTISAKNFNYSTEDVLNFSSDSLVVTITSSNASSNNSSFTLYGDNENIIFSENLNESRVTVNTDLIGRIPKKVEIELSQFSGQLTIVVAVQKP